MLSSTTETLEGLKEENSHLQVKLTFRGPISRYTHQKWTGPSPIGDDTPVPKNPGCYSGFRPSTRTSPPQSTMVLWWHHSTIEPLELWWHHSTIEPQELWWHHSTIEPWELWWHHSTIEPRELWWHHSTIEPQELWWHHSTIEPRELWWH